VPESKHRRRLEENRAERVPGRRASAQRGPGLLTATKGEDEPERQTQSRAAPKKGFMVREGNPGAESAARETNTRQGTEESLAGEENQQKRGKFKTRRAVGGSQTRQ
jgi:hypothetical protein